MTMREHHRRAVVAGRLAVALIKNPDFAERLLNVTIDDTQEAVFGSAMRMREAKFAARRAASHAEDYLRLRRAEQNRQAQRAMYESMGMVKVRGNLGGTYYE
jgi:hypothetical protein